MAEDAEGGPAFARLTLPGQAGARASWIGFDRDGVAGLKAALLLGADAGEMSRRIDRHTSRAPLNGVTCSTTSANASGLPSTAANVSAATVIAPRDSRSSEAWASAASPIAAALLLMTGMASFGPHAIGAGSAVVVGTSPSSARMVIASAGRSPVPMLPTSRTGGRALTESMTTNPSRRSGAAPLPPAAS